MHKPECTVTVIPNNPAYDLLFYQNPEQPLANPSYTARVLARFPGALRVGFAQGNSDDFEQLEARISREPTPFPQNILPGTVAYVGQEYKGVILALDIPPTIKFITQARTHGKGHLTIQELHNSLQRPKVVGSRYRRNRPYIRSVANQ